MLRSVMLKPSSFYKERSALKAWFALQSDVSAEAGRLISLTGLEQMHHGDALMEKQISDRIDLEPDLVDLDWRSELSGVQPNRTMRKQVKQGKNLPAITEHDLSTLEIWLKSGAMDPVAAIMGIASPTSIIPQNSIASVIARAVWLTGLRPVEIFSTRILLERDGKIIMRSGDLDDEMQDRMNQSDYGVTGVLLAGQLIQEIASELNAMPIMAIRNAKTTNANRDYLKEFRLLHLDYIDAANLGTLWLCTWLRYAGRLKIRQTAIIKGVTRSLTRASRACFPDRTPITLYSLRHDFCTRVKRAHGVAMAAVLMGHTSLKSTWGYGKTLGRTRKSSGGSWLPEPEASMLAIMEGRVAARYEAEAKRLRDLKGKPAADQPVHAEPVPVDPPAYIVEHADDWDVWNDGKAVLDPDMEP